MAFQRTQSIPPWAQTLGRDRGISIASDLVDLSDLGTISVGDLGSRGAAILKDDAYSCDHELKISTAVTPLVSRTLAGEVSAECKCGPEQSSLEYEWKKTLYPGAIPVDATVHLVYENGITQRDIKLENDNLVAGFKCRAIAGHKVTSTFAGPFFLLQAELERRNLACKVTSERGLKNASTVEASIGTDAAAVAAHASYDHDAKEVAKMKLVAQLSGRLGTFFCTCRTKHASTQAKLSQPVFGGHLHTTIGDKLQVAVGAEQNLQTLSAGAAYALDERSNVKAKVLLHKESPRIAVNYTHKLGPDFSVHVTSEINALALTSANAHKFGIRTLFETL